MCTPSSNEKTKTDQNAQDAKDHKSGSSVGASNATKGKGHADLTGKSQAYKDAYNAAYYKQRAKYLANLLARKKDKQAGKFKSDLTGRGLSYRNGFGFNSSTNQTTQFENANGSIEKAIRATTDKYFGNKGSIIESW